MTLTDELSTTGSSLRMRRADGVKPDQAVLVDLLVVGPKLEKESFIQLHCHNWTSMSKT